MSLSTLSFILSVISFIAYIPFTSPNALYGFDVRCHRLQCGHRYSRRRGVLALEVNNNLLPLPTPLIPRAACFASLRVSYPTLLLGHAIITPFAFWVFPVVLLLVLVLVVLEMTPLYQFVSCLEAPEDHLPP